MISLSFLWSLIYLCSSFYTTIYFQRWVSRKFSHLKLRTLPDMLHYDKLLWLTKYYKISDYIVSLYIFLLYYFNDHLPFFMYVLGTLHYLRTLSFCITILPKSGLMPDKDMNQSIKKIITDYLTLKEIHTGFNQDMFFSGHCTFIVVCSLYMTRFYPEYILTNIGLWILTISNSLFIVLTRCHYSIDVLYAFITSMFVFQNLDKL